MECLVCKGGGKQHLTVKYPFEDKPDETHDIDCVWCHGAGEMTEKEYQQYLWDKAAWCECGNPSQEFIFFDDGTCECGCYKHHYHCKDCMKITQIG